MRLAVSIIFVCVSIRGSYGEFASSRNDFSRRQGYARPELPDDDTNVSWDDQPATQPPPPPQRKTSVASQGREPRPEIPPPPPAPVVVPVKPVSTPVQGGADYDDPANWNLEDSIPGKPESDYPTYTVIPQTSFNCAGQAPGYYADTEARCQVFHVCENDGKRNSFLCPVGTIFNQRYFVCDWWANVDCGTSSSYYGLNDNLYKEPEKRPEVQPAPLPVSVPQKPTLAPLRNTRVESQGRTTSRPIIAEALPVVPAPVPQRGGSGAYSNDFDDSESVLSPQIAYHPSS